MGASPFRVLARTSNDQIGKILSGTRVPTRDGTWRAADEVVAHGGAVAFVHRLDPELSRLLPQSAQGSSDDPRKLRPSDAPAELTEKQSADSLRPILARAKVAVPAEMLAVLVFMLGRSDCWRALMREELGLATPVEDELTGTKATVHRIVIGLRHGQSNILRDGELLTLLNHCTALEAAPTELSVEHAATLRELSMQLEASELPGSFGFTYPKARPIMALVPAPVQQEADLTLGPGAIS